MEPFVHALCSSDLSLIRSVPKTDLHNHCLLGVRLEKIRELSGVALEPFHYEGNGIRDINRWISEQYAPLLRVPGMFEKIVEASFQQALEDGIVLLEMSIDVSFGHFYGIPAGQIIETLRNAHWKVAPGITFRPCLGFSRSMSVRQLLRYFEPYAGLNFFYSIDLYDDEYAQPVRNFRELYRFARETGLKCTAHAGEFGTAEMVREAVETLELDAVQHGIAAASSPEVMNWLAEREIPLNICPTSNLILQRVQSYAAHLIRILYDHGVRVTINTDDVTLFNQGVSEEYLNLYQAGVFTAEELEGIRVSSLES
ncbi:MAG: adenosine deaminase [bacterium]